MSASLGPRSLATLRAAARVLVPPGGSIPWGADDLDLASRIAEDVAGWPPRVRRRVRAFLLAFELLPLASRHRRRFSRLPPGAQAAFLEATYHHRWGWRRTLVSLMKQLCYAAYLSAPEVEEAVGYRYECCRPRAGVAAGAREQVHH